MVHLVLWIIVALAVAVLVILLVLAWVARPGRKAPSVPGGRPDPARSPQEAAERLARLQALDGSDCGDLCHTVLVEPPSGVPAKGTIVYFHGFTNCPAQFAEAARALAGRGWRVLTPRAPYHGNADVLTHDLLKLRIADLVAHVDMTVDAAAGFDGPLYLTGLSGGGVLAAWGAATRPEVTGLLAIAPIAAPVGMPLFIVRAFVAERTLMPQFYWWWDPRKKADLGEAPYVYPGFPFRGLQPYLHMAAALESGEVAPGHELEFANLQLNPGDFAVRPDAARRMMHGLGGHARHAEEIVLAKRLGWWHDFIDQHGSHKGTPEEVARVFEAGLGAGDPLAGGLIAYREPLEAGRARRNKLDDRRAAQAAAAGDGAGEPTRAEIV